ncbi:response regulator transcription factor [Streptomyces nigra]|uniref:response regulator transcription factor n=1 Tax=Streptomyces nigra TaxID=1827580 RepID=UPI00362AB7F8
MTIPASQRPLSERELQVLHHIARGHNRTTTGAALGISGHTVKSHLHRIAMALHARNTAHAVAITIRRGLLPNDIATTTKEI